MHRYLDDRQVVACHRLQQCLALMHTISRCCSCFVGQHIVLNKIRLATSTDLHCLNMAWFLLARLRTLFTEVTALKAEGRTDAGQDRKLCLAAILPVHINVHSSIWPWCNN